MRKKPKQQLSFDESIYTHPDSDNQRNDGVGFARKLKSKDSVKGKSFVPASVQPFLPGLSRRGRPRSANPVPATLRATQSRKRRIGAGAKRIELVLEQAVASDLDLLIEHYRISRAELISRLITQSAIRLRKKAGK